MNNAEIVHVIQPPSDANQLVRRTVNTLGGLEKLKTYQLQSVSRGVGF